MTQRRKDGVFKTVATVVRATGDAGAYSWTYGPGRRGVYRIRAKVTAAVDHTAAQTVWIRFSVK